MQFRAVVTIYVGLVATLSAGAADVASVAENIRVEARRSNVDADGRPLPLACSWHCGHFRGPACAPWRPVHQMRLIAQGHYLLPWFSHPPREGDVSSAPDDFRIGEDTGRRTVFAAN